MASFYRYSSLAESQPLELLEQLETYARQLRLGNFNGADVFWHDHSIHKSTSFPVIIVRAEGLLRQSAYGKANKFLDAVFEQQKNQPQHQFKSGQMKLLHIILAFCEIYTKGFLRRALSRARLTRDWLSKVDYRKYDAIQVGNALYLFSLMLTLAWHLDCICRVLSLYYQICPINFEFHGTQRQNIPL